MGVIAKYKFNQSTYANLIPTFNNKFTDYTITDEIDTDGYTIRTIESDSLPTSMTFGAVSQSNRTKSLLEVYECNTSNITSMGNMFRWCTALTSLNTSNFDTSKVTDMNCMFYYCSSLTSLDVSSFNTEKVTNMQQLFFGCSKLTSLDVSSFNTEKVTNMFYMFSGCSSLTTLDLSNFSTSNVDDMYAMFVNCKSLTSLNLSSFNTSKITSMNGMFQNCSSLTSLDVSKFNTEKVTDMQQLFQNCSSLTSLDVSNWNVEKVTNMNSMFLNCTSLVSLDLSNWNTIAIKDISSMFNSCYVLEEIKGIESFNTDNVTNMVQTFRICRALKTLDLSKWNDTKVTTMHRMFQQCLSLETLDVSGFTGALSSDYSYWFEQCSKLKSVDLSNFNFSSTDTFTGMFDRAKIENVGMIYSSAESINTLASLLPKSTIVFYYDAEPSELTTQTNITYVPYNQSVLSCSEEITLRSNGDICDELNLLTGQLTQRIDEDGEILTKEIVKTVNLTIKDQDNQPQTTLHAIPNGYIITSSQGLLPKVTYEIPTPNLYLLDMVKPNTLYTTKSSLDCNATIDGTSYPLSANGTFTTPSTITNNFMVLDTPVDDLMIIEGDVTGRELDYFTGLQSVDMPVLTISNKDRSKTNILTTHQPITLHRIGDVKDELDLVNECVVRRISLREYQDGDLTDNSVITDMINTLYKLATPTTEPIRIVPQNPKQSTVSLTLQSPLQKVGNIADQLRWNPYKGHYVRYNYIQDGVANSTYTFEDLKDMNERKFVNLYKQRTYIDTDHTVQVISHGLSRYCLAEQGKQYQVRWDWVEQPSVDTIKVDLCGNVKEIPSDDNSVVIDVEKFTHQFIQIQGLGLTGKITNLMVIETVDGEIPDVDFFSGIQCVGNTVSIDGNTKVQIDMEQTNGNLFDNTIEIYNNGNNIRFMLDMVRPNKTYTFKHGNSVITKAMKYNQKQFNDGGQYAIQISNNGSANIHYPTELCYADMTKDGIRPRYYDKESIILPMKLCRVGNIYDNLYYDDLKGYYRIQQSIGHKYFTGETTEVWTMETTNGYRTIKFTCTSANIDQIALGKTICNSFRHLSTINNDIEGFIIYNGNFILRIYKDRLTDKTVDGFKTLLASSPIHLFYQLKTPQMINLTEYPNRIEFNTYRDEIFTFFKGMNPTKFTLSVPMDKTYRYEIEEEGQGLANRVTVNNETISAENMVAVKEVRGQGIANIIEDVDNVVITPRPNHSGKATSHTLNNTKPAIIRVHGFEPSGDTAIGTYNTTDKAYQLKVMSSNGDNSLSNYYVLNIPYKLETYADGTKDMVYYDEDYKQWHFKGSSVKEYTATSDGTLNEVVEVFKGLAPRSGMIAEFKLMFTSGTTNSRMYYSLNGTIYSYTSLRTMSDGNYLYVGIFNTGGTKIDIAYKTDPNAEYTNLSPLSTQVPECFMVNQIQFCTFCEVTLDKQYIYSEINAPIELDAYDGTTKVFMDGNVTDTNIIIKNEATTKIVNTYTYTDTEYTVYWKYVDGLGNLRITLGGTTVEVDGKQEYATIKTQLNAPQELLYIGGYNLSIKDLMVVKGAKINDLPYFEGSRQVGTLVLDEEGNKSYKITLVQGGSVLEQRDEDTIAFKDDNKHNVVVHKIVGVCPTKVD